MHGSGDGRESLRFRSIVRRCVSEHNGAITFRAVMAIGVGLLTTGILGGIAYLFSLIAVGSLRWSLLGVPLEVIGVLFTLFVAFASAWRFPSSFGEAPKGDAWDAPGHAGYAYGDVTGRVAWRAPALIRGKGGAAFGPALILHGPISICEGVALLRSRIPAPSRVVVEAGNYAQELCRDPRTARSSRYSSEAVTLLRRLGLITVGYTRSVGDCPYVLTAKGKGAFEPSGP